MKVTIDRFEDGYAVLLVRGDEADSSRSRGESVQIDFPAEYLPEGCREGDILDIDISRNEAETKEAHERVSDLIEKLKKKKYD